MLDINQIYNADCLEKMKEIDDKSIDMILCDLPYQTTSLKWDVIIPLEPLWEHYERIIKDNGAIVLTAVQPFTSKLIMSNIKLFKYCWVWNKKRPSSFLNAKNAPMKKTEDICIFSFGKIANGSVKLMKYNPQELIRCNKLHPLQKDRIENSTIGNRPSRVNSYKQDFTNYPTNLIEFSHEKNPIHSTQKPIKLFEYFIKTYTNEGDLILDNCSGSGTTAIASINTNRNYICIEKDEEYYNKSIERIKRHTKIDDFSNLSLFQNRGE